MKSKTLDLLLIKNPNKIKEWWHEGEDGYWLALKTGWNDGNCCHSVSGMTVIEILSRFKDVIPCGDSCECDYSEDIRVNKILK